MDTGKPANMSVWRRLSRYSISREKISRPIIRRFVRQHASSKRTLVIHPEEGLEHFPDRFVVSARAGDKPDLLVDDDYAGLSVIPDGSYEMILCVGLLEHIATPERFVADIHRILAPGGRALLKCSCCFSVHEAPGDYFHYTTFGIRVLFRQWRGFDVLQGSCGPFTTIGILLQRILMQCEIFPPLRPIIEMMAHGFPMLDRFVVRQYGTVNRFVEDEMQDSMLPSNLWIVAVR